MKTFAIRSYIRKIILEAYSLSAEDQERAKELGIDYESSDPWEQIEALMVDYAELDPDGGLFAEGPSEEMVSNIKKFVAQVKKAWSDRPGPNDEGYAPEKHMYHNAGLSANDVVKGFKEYLDMEVRSKGEDYNQVLSMFTYAKFLKALFQDTSGQSGRKRRQIFQGLPGFANEEFRRATGLQSEEEQMEDRKFLKDYQEKLRASDAGKAMIKDFMNGNIAILHSISYESWASRQGETREDRGSEQSVSPTPFTKWFKRFGKSGKNTLSTVAINDSMDGRLDHNGSNRRVVGGMGFVLKGYPIMVSEEDVMSQNLGSIGQGLIDFHKDSGQVKRASKNLAKPVNPASWEWADEVLLDNWTVIGTYINMNLYYEGSAVGPDNFKAVLKDGLKLNKPVYIVLRTTETIKLESEADVDDIDLEELLAI